MEFCNVCPNQKVDMKKLTAEQSSLIIKESAVHPNVRYQDIMDKVNKACIAWSLVIDRTTTVNLTYSSIAL